MFSRFTSNIKLGNELLIFQKRGQRLKRILKDLNIGLYLTKCKKGKILHSGRKNQIHRYKILGSELVCARNIWCPGKPQIKYDSGMCCSAIFDCIHRSIMSRSQNMIVSLYVVQIRFQLKYCVHLVFD